MRSKTLSPVRHHRKQRSSVNDRSFLLTQKNKIMDDLITFAIMVVLAFLLLSKVDRKYRTLHQRKYKSKIQRLHAQKRMHALH
ncbi:MAG: hypothetical protein ABI763_10865 [Bacteroidota bacterium]